MLLYVLRGCQAEVVLCMRPERETSLSTRYSPCSIILFLLSQL